jgi:hypothetical protein
MTKSRLPALLAIALVLPLATGCVSRRAPTVAHVHIGHAITGVHVTPNKEGYIVSAERRAKETAEFTSKATASHDLAAIKSNVALASKATNDDETFGVKESLVMAVNHITFAATSDDATLNVQKAAPGFASDSARVIERCDLIGLLSKDVQASTSEKEAVLLVGEIAKLAQANLTGDDSNGDGVVGSTPSEYGLLQLRKELEDMIGRENPPYVTVDQWYLFNLVRLPNGKWVFDKFGRGGNIEGYK